MFEHTSAHAEQSTYGEAAHERVGFFTDTTLCIGCKACEVACKEWNDLPVEGYSFAGQSYDNTGELSGTTWRHVAFVEQRTSEGSTRWLMESDVCKHCTHAACLDVCPTGAIVRSEFGTVVIQDDICNGCAYCVSACPYGVVAKQETGHGHGGAGKCTMCYDRLKIGKEPACAKTCPTDSIQFGKLDELRERAQARLTEIGARYDGARLYGNDPDDGVGGTGSIFLLLDRPEVYGLPPNPVVPTKRLGEMWTSAALAAGALALVFAGALARK
jgi:formate dehydrogenase iron-sulfur subunit